MRLIPLSLKTANAFVAAWHRHHAPVRGHKFSLGAEDDAGQLRAVAIIGRPVARALDDGRTLEVLRLASDGARNACSFLYGAARRAGLVLGYRRVITYTLDSESGLSLRAAGWTLEGTTRGGGWSCPSRPRADLQPTGPKRRWSVAVAGSGLVNSLISQRGATLRNG